MSSASLPHVIILAGGGGTRLWPRSRYALPKFLVDVGTGQPLLLDAVRRARGITQPEQIHVVTSDLYAAATREVIGEDCGSLIIEPSPRDTTAAIALANATIEAKDAEAMVIELPADQTILDDDAWLEAIQRLTAAASNQTVACLGLIPRSAHTGYGYMHAPAGVEPRAVLGFHEKPDRASARRYVESGDYLWSVSILAWRAGGFARLLGQHAPIAQAVAARLVRGVPGAEQEWFEIPCKSIEHGFLEPAAAAGQLRAVPALLPSWSDLGTWESVADRATGEAEPDWLLTHRSQNCFVMRDEKRSRRFVFLGVNDLLVIEDDDVVFITKRGTGQQVRDLVAEIAERGWTDLL